MSTTKPEAARKKSRIRSYIETYVGAHVLFLVKEIAEDAWNARHLRVATNPGKKFGKGWYPKYKSFDDYWKAKIDE